MTQLLRVSGIAVPVLVDQASHKPTSIGEVERAEDGTKLISRRAIKEAFKVRVAHQAPSDGIAWKRLFTGEGEVWNFEDPPLGLNFYGSKGTGPSASTGATIDGANGKYGTKACRLAATTGTISYVALPPGGTKWGVMVWRKLAGGAHSQYVVTSAGHKWVDGVRNDAASTTWLTVTTSTGTVKLDADAALNTYFDDLVIFPFDVPDVWPPDVFAYAAAFSQLAKLDVDGDLVNANVGTLTVCGEVMGVDVVAGTLNGTYYQAIRVVDVALDEG